MSNLQIFASWNTRLPWKGIARRTTVSAVGGTRKRASTCPTPTNWKSTSTDINLCLPVPVQHTSSSNIKVMYQKHNKTNTEPYQIPLACCHAGEFQQHYIQLQKVRFVLKTDKILWTTGVCFSLHGLSFGSREAFCKSKNWILGLRRNLIPCAAQWHPTEMIWLFLFPPLETPHHVFICAQATNKTKN